MFRSYERILARAPIAVKTATGTLLGFAGDGTVQTLEGGDYDVHRGIAFTSLAATWNGPCMHASFAMLERSFPQSAGWRSLFPKLLCTQFFINPFVYLPLFYSWTGVVLGRSVEETLDKARREYWTTLRATWAIMAPFNVVNFLLIPVRHQTAALACVSFVYQVMLSAIANADRRISWHTPRQLVRTLSDSCCASDTQSGKSG